MLNSVADIFDSGTKLESTYTLAMLTEGPLAILQSLIATEILEKETKATRKVVPE